MAGFRFDNPPPRIVCFEATENYQNMSARDRKSFRLNHLASYFADNIPDKSLSPAEIHGFLLKRKGNPTRAIMELSAWRDDLLNMKAEIAATAAADAAKVAEPEPARNEKAASAKVRAVPADAKSTSRKTTTTKGHKVANAAKTKATTIEILTAQNDGKAADDKQDSPAVSPGKSSEAAWETDEEKKDSKKIDEADADKEDKTAEEEDAE
jgi:hypothetical protein